MMSNFENVTLLNCELPRSTQSFEKMLDEVGLALDNVTRTRTASTTFSEILCRTGINNCGEIESADDKVVNKSSDGNSLSVYSICTTCTQCKLGKELSGNSNDIGTAGIESDKVSSVSECDGLSLFVDQIDCEPTAEGRENIPKRSHSDTVTGGRFVPEYSCKRFKSEAFSPASRLQTNSTGGKIEPDSTICLETREIFARYRHCRALPGDEDPSEPAELNYNNDQRTNVSEVSLKASANPDEPDADKSALIKSTDNVVGQITVSSHTLEVDSSTSARSNIEEVRFIDETKDDDDQKNAPSILEHGSLSPNPSTSVHPDDPDESNSQKLAQIESAENVLGQIIVSSDTLEVDNSTFARSNINKVRHADETKDDDDPKNAATILEHESLSPNPSTSVHPVDPDEPSSEKSEQMKSVDNVVGQVTVLSHILQVDSSTSVRSNIEEVRSADETKDDGASKNAASILEYETLSPHPAISVSSQNTIEEVYQIEEDHHGNDFKSNKLTDDFESRSLISYDPTLTVTQIYHVNATDDIDRSNSIQVAEGLPHDSEERERTKEWERPAQNPEERRSPLKGEILEETAIDSDAALQIDEGRSLESVTVENDEVKVLNNLETEAEEAKKSLNPADDVRSLEPDTDSVKNEKTSRFLDESFLEVSIDSAKMYVEMNSRENREDRTTRAPVDLTTINKKRVSQDAGAGCSKEVKRDEKLTEVLNPICMVQNPPANFTEPKKSSKDADDTSLDLLSESELERIEKEAYKQSNKTHITANLKNVNLDEEDRFYRPQRRIRETKNEDNLVLPRWVTNPAPEPNYDMIRSRNQSRKEYVNKILQEVLRLSEIISKVAKAMRGELNSDQVPQIQGRSAEDYPNLNVRASTSTENRSEDSDLFYATQSSSRPKHIAHSNCSDIFYAPQSLGRCKRKESPSLSNNVTIHRPVKLEASVDTVDAIKANYSVEIREPDRFYVPQSGQSKYDASFIFSGQKDKASCSYSNTEATSFYNPSVNSGSSKRDWSGNKTGGYVAMNDRRIETGNSGEYQLPKNRLQASFESDTRIRAENGNIDRMNNCKTVSKNAVFYSPDNSSSASSIYTRLPSVQNSQIFYSDNLPAKPTTMNFGKNLIARTNRNDNDSVFYSGNK